MAQSDVLKWLSLQRTKGNHEYFLACDIVKGLQQQGLSSGVLKGVYDDLLKLTVKDFLQCKGVGIMNHKKTFRIKKEYVT